MPPIRASRLPLLTKCSGSLFIPCPPDGDESDANVWGHLAHHWKQHGTIDDFQLAPEFKRLRNAFKKALKLSGIGRPGRRQELWPNGGHHESSVAVRVDGVREAVLDPNREYVGREGWITGTADFWWKTSNNTFGKYLWVDDLKTGKQYPNPARGQRGHVEGLEEGGNRFPQDPSSPQIRFYGLGVAAAVGVLTPDLDVSVSVTHWPRLPLVARHSPPTTMTSGLSGKDLLDYWTQLEDMYRNPRVVPGDHCRFCPARTNCVAAQTFD